MPPLRPIPTVETWTDEIVAAVREELTASITVRTPAVKGKYDPKTDKRTEGSPAVVLITGRPARLQARKATNEASTAGEWSKKRRYTVQFEPAPGDPILRKGLEIVVDSCPDSPHLVGIVFQVELPRISSRVALMTVDVVSEFGGAE